ncbi:MAG: glycosyltransferase [Vulcanimicrobiaceae bacterium]
MKYSPPLAITLASLAAWAFLLVGRGRFWTVRPDAHRGRIREQREIVVEAIVPARDEAGTIGPAIASLVRQQFAGTFRVTLVDDASGDETARIARDAIAADQRGARFASVPGRPLERGWTGKLNALETGVAAVRALRRAPDYWLFTDADIAHDERNVATLVAKARRDGLALVSLMVRLRCESGWERLLVPAFVFFFAKLYPFAWSNDPTRASAAAAGGCILISNAALERIGGLASVAGHLIDDCALAAAVKASGGRLYMGLTATTQSIRPYEGLGPLWKMVRRSAFTQLGRSYPAVAGAVAGMAFLYLVPPAATLIGVARRRPALASCGALGWCAMALAYRPMTAFYGRGPLAAFELPLAATFYTAMTLDSALAHARGRGGAWKGRYSPLR